MSNLVLNGNFELGTTNWTTDSKIGYRTDTESPTRGQVLYFATDGATADATQIIATTANTNYTLTYSLKNTGGPNGIYFSVLINGAEYSPSIVPNTSGSFDWTVYSFDITATSTSTTLTFRGQNDTAVFYLDDISLIKPTTDSIVVNGEFDNDLIGTGWTLGPNVSIQSGLGLPQLDASGNVPISGTTTNCLVFAINGTNSTRDVSQTLNTVTNSKYTLTYYLKSTGGATDGQYFSALWNGQDISNNSTYQQNVSSPVYDVSFNSKIQILSGQTTILPNHVISNGTVVTNSSTTDGLFNWIKFRFTVQATSPISTLTFRSRNDQAAYYLDGVSVTRGENLVFNGDFENPIQWGAVPSVGSLGWGGFGAFAWHQAGRSRLDESLPAGPLGQNGAGQNSRAMYFGVTNGETWTANPLKPIETIPNTYYYLTYYLRHRQPNTAGNTLSFIAIWNDVGISESAFSMSDTGVILNPPGITTTDGFFAYAKQTFLLKATSTSTNLSFQSRSDVSFFGLDDISVVQAFDSPCFNKDTKILCMVCSEQDTLQPKNVNESNEIYIKIQDIKKGTYVKTYKHGYRRVDLIGHGSFINNPDYWNGCMYRMKENPELIVTGGHSILVDEMSEEEHKKNRQYFCEDIKIDDKYLLLACVSDKFEKIQNNDRYTYYHFTLENDGDDDRRFGVWANGILTETPSKNQFTEYGL
jgi:hypothetical protein